MIRKKILNETNRRFAHEFKVSGLRLDRLLSVAFLIIVLVAVATYLRSGAEKKTEPVQMAKKPAVKGQGYSRGHASTNYYQPIN